MTYDILKEAERIASEALPEYDARSLRKIMESAWAQALRAHFIVRRDLDG